MNQCIFLQVEKGLIYELIWSSVLEKYSRMNGPALAAFLNPAGVILCQMSFLEEDYIRFHLLYSIKYLFKFDPFV